MSQMLQLLSTDVRTNFSYLANKFESFLRSNSHAKPVHKNVTRMFDTKLRSAMKTREVIENLVHHHVRDY